MCKLNNIIIDFQSYNNNQKNNLIDYTIEKAFQRSIALLRQDIRKIIREELISASLKGGIQV